MLHLSSLIVFVLLTILPLTLCAEDYYKLLDVPRSATEKDIKRAYRTLSKKYHPDKNPDNSSAHDKFVAIAEAYDALSTPETRKIYDQHGHEGLKRHQQSGGQPHHDPFDLFSRFFGGGGHFGQGGGQRRGQDMQVQISIPLKDFYTGAKHDFAIEKQHICEECEGTGSADGQVETCNQCGGRGVVVRRQMLAPGISQQVQMPCDKCNGQGKSIKKPCKVCHGHKVVRKQASYTLEIEKGLSKGGRVVFENEADESPDWVAGDMIVSVLEKDPELGSDDASRVDGTFFRRKEKDLHWKEVLSLREAWLGDWTRNLTHLDGHVVRLGRARGEVVQPGRVELVKGEGMPQYEGGPEDYGSLVVEYVVVLPDQMEKGMEKEFWAVWEKYKTKKGVQLDQDGGRPPPRERDEL